MSVQGKLSRKEAGRKKQGSGEKATCKRGAWQAPLSLAPILRKEFWTRD